MISQQTKPEFTKLEQQNALGTDFTVDYTTSNLIHQNGKFYMENDKVDNAAVDSDGNPVGQFSLVDVEFYDPSDSTKVAYHLYVPVVVKKLMKFEFESSLLSGTTYRAEPYLANRANTLIENLGTPVTMQFRYTYQQSLEDWRNAVYSGDSLIYKPAQYPACSNSPQNARIIFEQLVFPVLRAFSLPNQNKSENPVLCLE